MDKLKENGGLKSKESIMTLGLVTFEAIVISILEGMVIMNHLGLVQNCSATVVEEGTQEGKEERERDEMCINPIFLRC